MNTIRIESAFKALGKMYQLLAYENYYFRGGHQSQREWIDYDNRVNRIKASIKKLEDKILF